MDITVHHPAPYRHVPKGRRTPEDALVRVATPARLTVLEPGALERVRNQPASVPELHVGDGALWTRLAVHPLKPGQLFHRRRVWLSPEAFVAWAGQPRIRDDGGLGAVSHCFRGTPLAAAWQDPGPPDEGSLVHRWHGRTSGGGPLPESARVLLDDRGRAADGLRAFLDGEVRLCGDGVFLRSDLMSAVHDFGDRRVAFDGRTPDPGQSLPLRVDRAAAFSRYHARLSSDPRVDRFLEGLGRLVLGDQDLRFHANALPIEADAVARLLARRKDVPRMPDELAGWALRARVGGVRVDEAERACALAAAYIREACLSPGGRRLSRYETDRRLARLRVFEEQVLPLVRGGAEPSEEDARELALLAP